MRPQFLVNNLMDEPDVFDDGKVGTGPNMDLQPRIGEPSPAKGMAPRHVWITACGETGNRYLPRRLGRKLVVVGHPKFGPYNREHQVAQFDIVEQLLSGLDVEMPDQSSDHIIWLVIRRQIDAELH